MIHKGIPQVGLSSKPEELLVHDGTGKQTKSLEAYDSYLRRRWSEGCTNAAQLDRELRVLGYRGASTVVRQYVRPWRTGLPPAPARRRPPTVRQAIGWFLRNHTNLDPDEQRQLDALCASCPQLAALRAHVRDFAQMMPHRRGHRLEAWMTAVLHDDLPELHSFITGLCRDQDAVTAGLTVPYSSGPVEGHINPHQNDQETDGRPRAPRPAPQARPAGRLSAGSAITESVPEP